MRISSYTLETVGGLLPNKVANARSAWSAREGIWLTLRDDEGFVGLGECSPLPGYSAASLGECRAALAAMVVSALPRPTTGPLDLPALIAAFSPLAGLPPPARFAIETAWLDLVARRAGVAISALLGGPEDAVSGDGQRAGVAVASHGQRVGEVDESSEGPEATRITVARSGLLPVTDDLTVAIAAARELRARGIHTMKVKIGRPGVPFAQELAWLGDLRDAIDADMSLRLDANGAFSLAETPERLEQLARLRPELIEEPTGGIGLSTLGPCAIPWAADESLGNEATARAILDRGGCAALVLKPANLGLIRCLALATEARQRGLGVIVTHLFDGPIGLATACELALALSRLTRHEARPAPGVLPCGLALHEALMAYPPMDIPQLREPGVIVPADRPGHGILRRNSDVV